VDLIGELGFTTSAAGSMLSSAIGVNSEAAMSV
jgi:hypothetical protein